jgi:hypothetical protein
VSHVPLGSSLNKTASEENVRNRGRKKTYEDHNHGNITSGQITGTGTEYRANPKRFQIRNERDKMNEDVFHWNGQREVERVRVKKQVVTVIPNHTIFDIPKECSIEEKHKKRPENAVFFILCSFYKATF